MKGTLRRQSLCLGTVGASGASYILRPVPPVVAWTLIRFYKILSCALREQHRSLQRAPRAGDTTAFPRSAQCALRK